MTNTNILKRSERDPKLKAALTFLRERGAWAAAHSADCLGNHLLGTASILVSWRCKRAVWMAGLLHSVYGTQTAPGLVGDDERQVIAELVGAPAEALVHMYSLIPLPALLELRGQCVASVARWINDCMDLHAANALEQLERITLDHEDFLQQKAMFARILPGLCPGASEAIVRTFKIATAKRASPAAAP